MLDRQSILDAYRLDTYLTGLGVSVKTTSHKFKCSCPLHKDDTPSMSVDMDKRLWKCFSCGHGGTVIDLHMRVHGMGFKDAIFDLAEKAGIDTSAPTKTVYSYKDELGRERMRIDRIDTGKKKQCYASTVNDDGRLKKGIEGINRTLYRLENWAGKDEVALVEGEKCVDAMEKLGFDATCNPGGSTSWLDAYACYLKDKHVDVWPDNDEPGEKWTQAVLKSLEGKVASLRVVRVPKEYGDVADLIDAQGDDMAAKTIIDLLDNEKRIDRGVQIELLSSAECYDIYQRSVKDSNEFAVDLGKWLPSLRHCARLLLPGDMAVFLSDTGVGKTVALSNIAYSQRPIPTIFFELELSPQAMTERFIARDLGVPTLSVEENTKHGKQYDVSGWDHVFICPESKMTIERMEEIIIRAELKIQQKPRLILVDYIGLMSGTSGKRYERMSTIAEGLKVLARTTNTVVVMASQVRREQDRTEIELHDAKDSGSVENSAQLVMGAWRPQEDKMTIKILKQTKRAGQIKIECNFNGDRQLITEIQPERGLIV